MLTYKYVNTFLFRLKLLFIFANIENSIFFQARNNQELNYSLQPTWVKRLGTLICCTKSLFTVEFHWHLQLYGNASSLPKYRMLRIYIYLLFVINNLLLLLAIIHIIASTTLPYEVGSKYIIHTIIYCELSLYEMLQNVFIEL